MTAPVLEAQPKTEKASAIRVVDCDVHQLVGLAQCREYLPQPFKRMAESGCAPGHLGLHNPIGVVRSDLVESDGKNAASKPDGIGRTLLDPYGIDIALLTGGVYGFSTHPDPDYAAAVCSAYNSYMIEHWLPKDPRFRMAINVATQDAALAAEEIARVGSHPGVCAALISSATQHPLGQRMYHPLFAACEKYDLPLCLHPGSEGTCISNPPTAAGYPTRYLEWHTGISCTFQAHLVSLVCEGVFQKFPGLKIVLVEGGVSWLPPLMWRLDKNWKALRSTVPWITRAPSEIIQERVFMTTQPIEEPPEHRQLKQLFEMFDAEKMLLFSSDYPHWDGDTPDFAVRGFPESFKRRVLAENAVELFGL
ncbi:MAG: amidohydrolase [Planctomycetota bacterium]|nr:amidohydrolase [Planctomycetota bacterium]